MAKVITTQDAAFTAFTQATQHAQSRAQAAETERAATEAARLALPTQVQAITGPAVQAAQMAASLAVQRAGVVGSVANDAALAGRAAGDYRVGLEIVSWNGNAVTARTAVLASDADVQAAQALAEQAESKAGTASDLAEGVTTRLQFPTVAAAQAATLTTGQTVVIQDAYRGGVFVVGPRVTADNVLTFDAAAGLTLTRQTGGQPLTVWWGGAAPGADGLTNAAGIQRTLDCARDRGIQAVYVPPGDYLHAATLTHHAGLTLYGPQSAVLRTTLDIVQLSCPARAAENKNVVLQGLTVRREKLPTTKPQIEYWDTTLCRITGTDVYQWEWAIDAQGIPTTTYYNSVAGIHLRTSGGAVPCYGAEIRAGILSGASLWVQASDSRILGGYYWGHAREYAVKLDAPNIEIDDCDVIPSASSAGTGNGGIWCTPAANDFQIGAGVRIDGSWAYIPSGWGITANGCRGRIGALHAYWCGRGAIRAQGGAEIIIADGATFADNNRVNWPDKAGQAVEAFSYPDIFIDSSSRCVKGRTKHTITEPRNRAGGGGVAPAVRESGTANLNTYGDTIVSGSYAGAVALAGAQSRITGRVIDQGGKLSHAAGVGAVPSAGTLIVPHGLYGNPERVQLTMMQTPAAGQRAFVSGRDGVNLVIGVEPAPAAGQTLSVAWQAWVTGAE